MGINGVERVEETCISSSFSFTSGHAGRPTIVRRGFMATNSRLIYPLGILKREEKRGGCTKPPAIVVEVVWDEFEVSWVENGSCAARQVQ